MPNWKKVIVSGSDASLNSLSVATNVVAQSFTGSLFGTSSYASQALSSSFAISSSRAVSSSFATTSSYTFTALSSSFASTASYVNPLRQDVIVTGSLNVSGSTIIKGGLTVDDANDGDMTFGSRTLSVNNTTNPFYISHTNAYGGVMFNYGPSGKNLFGFGGDDDYTNGRIVMGNWTTVNYQNANSSSYDVPYGTFHLYSRTGENAFNITTQNGTANFLAHAKNATGSLQNISFNNNYVYISSSGNVGFGTATPGVKVDVVGQIRSNSTIFSSANQTQKIIINSTTQLTFENTGSVEIARVTNAGNWGFGTTNPQYKLDVSGSGNFTNNLTVTGSLIAPSITGSLFGTSSWSNNAISSSYAQTSSYTFTALSSSFASTASYVNPLNQDVKIVGRLIVSASSSPSIDATFGNYPISANDGANGGFSVISYNTRLRQNYLQLYGTNGAGMSSTANGNLSIGKYTSDVLTASIFVSSSGNVGFGTSTPTEKVHVVGNGLFTGDLTVQGKITAEEFHTEFVSASIIYRSGSTKFGDTSDDTHQFTGSLRVNGSITGSLFGTASYATQALSASYSLSSSYAVTSSHALNVSVRTEGTSLYSFNPATSNFSQADGIFLGLNAGSNASAADGAVMIGSDAGQGATNAEYSIMIGTSAGSGAPNTGRSIFLGNNAGFSASNAAYSNFIGHNAGSGNNIGQNNILIGTGVALPSGSRDRINIAGLIFGSGSYFNESDTSSGSANGKIGINQPNPQYSFDVSGSGNFTNNLYVTGGLLVTQSYISTVDYIDFTTNPGTLSHLEGRIHWDDDRKTLELDTDANDFTINVGHMAVLRGRNTNSFTLTKGTVVYINGNSGQFATFATASWETDPSSAYSIGLVAQDISPNNYGYAVTDGEILGVNTNAFAPATLLYLSSSGQYTDVVPTAPNHTVRLGQVVVQSTNGILQVKVDNGYELGELHDIRDTTTTSSYGDLLVKSGATWINTHQLTGSYGLTGSLNISQGITGSLFGTASEVQNAAVKISGSTLYSTVNSLSDFTTNNSVLLGASAGTGTSNGFFSVLIGDSAGQNATNMTYTVGIGSRAGLSQVSSSYSIFIGRNAGRAATTANQLGRNNIVIGTGISLSGSKQDSINIGGLIFGSGSYYGPAAGTTFLGSANGKVGINQPDPLYSFDVSGSGNYTNGLTVTGSVIAPSITGSLFGTSSYATQALSSSFAISSSFGATSLSSSYALTASYALNAAPMNVVYITGSETQLRINSGSINTYYRVSTTGALEVQITTNSNRPGIPTGSQIIIEKLITGSLTIFADSGVGYTGSLYIPYQYQTLTLTKVNTDEWVGVGGYDNQLITFNSQSSTTYTLVKEDVGRMIRLNNASAINVTVPPNSSQAFPIGSIVSLEQQGAGIVTCITGSGVTINSTARKTWGQYTVIQVYKVGTDTWNVIGGVD